MQSNDVGRGRRTEDGRRSENLGTATESPNTADEVRDLPELIRPNDENHFLPSIFRHPSIFASKHLWQKTKLLYHPAFAAFGQKMKTTFALSIFRHNVPPCQLLPAGGCGV
jgi:hypothetical protein